MPDWTAPFHMPDFTDEKFAENKAKYVAKYGYTITVPGLSDIIKIPIEKPMTLDEQIDYKLEDWKKFSEERLADIRKMKKRRKDRYLAMLASPSPEIFRNAGSIMTSIDDAQDALSTLSFIGRVAVKFAPRILGKIFAGPVGWLLAANDMLNLMNHIGRTVTMPTMGKRTKEQATDSNPFSKKARIRRALKLKNVMPTKGTFIEGLQVSNDVFGFGVCLGPIIGLAQDVIAGTVRSALGQPVRVRFPTPDFRGWYKRALVMQKAMAVYQGVGWRTDDDEFLQIYMAGYLASQALMPFQQNWNPLEAVEDVATAEVRAPVPANVLTLEVIEEVGIPLEEVCGWPHSGALWANTEEISDAVQPVATDNLNRFMTRNQHSWMGYAGGTLATETADYTLANLEGPEAVEYNYNSKSRVAGVMLAAGYYVDPDQPRNKLDLFVLFLDYIEAENIVPTMVAIEDFCRWNGIELLTFPS